MIDKIRNVLTLVDYPYKNKMIFSVVGSALVSLIEMFGVAASYPLLLVVSGADISTGFQGKIASFLNIHDRQYLIIVIAVIVAGCFIFKSIISTSFRWWQLGFVNDLEKTARTNLLRKYLDAPYLAHRARQISDLHTYLVTSIFQSFNQVIMGILTFFANFFTATLLLVVMLVVSPIAATVAILLFAGAGLLLPLILKNKLKAVSSEATEADRITWYSSIPALQAFREMRLFDVAENFVNTYRGGAALRAHANKRNSFYSELPKYLIEVVFVFSVAILAVLLFAMYPSEKAISIMGVFTVTAMRMLPSVNTSIAMVNTVRAGTVGLDIIDAEVTQLNKAIPHSQIPKKDLPFDGNIAISHLTFGYNSQQPVLDNISLHIPAGTTVAFVGSSGSGKSTLIDLILGLLPPDSGTIESNSVNIQDDVKTWQDKLGVIPQTIYMLPGSLRENIAFGQETNEIDDEAVIRAIKAAELDELVETLPNGIYEDLGQEGNRLSGGQRQRLGIARALYRNPTVLIMDEATSALDNKTEHNITKTVEQLKGKVTTIIVAHRLSTIKNADQIYYLKDGHIHGQGTFAELEKKIPEFAELVALGKI